MQEELEAVRAELLATKHELTKSRDETAAALEGAEAMKAKASIDMDNLRRNAAEQLALHKFGLERFMTDNDSIKFYTGFPSYEHVKLFYEFLRPTAQTMTYCYASGERESRPRARTMQLIDEVFMFLVRLKLGLYEQDLAHRFHIHMSSVSRKLITWTNYLYFLLGSQTIWPSSDDVKQYMPEGFRKLYPTTRVILDCT